VYRSIDGYNCVVMTDEMVYIGELAGLSVAYLAGLAFLVCAAVASARTRTQDTGD
jgi:hypothetical protein